MSKAKRVDEISANEAELAEVSEATTEADIEATAEIEPVVADEDTTVAAEDQPTEEPKLAKAGKRSKKAVEEATSEETRKAKAEQPEEVKPRVQSKPNPLKQHGKNYRKSAELVEEGRQYELAEAIALAKKTSTVKFDASLELHVNLGVDARQADQMVRANVTLPAGTGKTLRIAVLAPASEQAAVEKAGADVVGEDDLLAKIEKGQIDFDRLITTPALMPKLAKQAKVLGPKGLMPNPKSGSVATDLVKAVTESKTGKVEFRIDKQSIIHQAFGKVSFKDEDLLTNLKTLIDAIMKAKPGAAKGTYVKGMTLTTTMGPSLRLNTTKAIAEANPKK